ncbi:MAG: C39 family peptidase [Oscillospiraceae bacterium]|nr:C39 family peptidase [Oscillospiraceae bacterium]MDY6208811.1 C39 family peptidase [Oscillospiraceae bacterium]
MNKKSSKQKKSKFGIMLFFAAVIGVSIFMLVHKESDIEVIEADNTLAVSQAETDIIPEETVSRSYGHDIEQEFPPEEQQETETAATAPAPDDPEYSDIPEAVTDAEETSVTTSRTVITSRQRKDYDSNSVYIDMANILQNPELPVGCEITALTILLNYYGFDADKTDMAKNYLPTSWGNPRTVDGKLYKDSFFDYFIGDPFSRGYGCFSPAIEKAANAYISSHGGGYTVKNISGCHPDTLYEYLIAGTPVLCWATDGMIEPEYYETWYDNATGVQLDWYLNEHCFVLAGFNIANSTVTLNDPMKGIIDYNIDKFEVRFKQMHSQAIVLIPEGGEEVTTQAVTEPPVSESESITEQTAETLPSETVSETVSETAAETASETSSESVTSETTTYVDTEFFTGTFVS